MVQAKQRSDDLAGRNAEKLRLSGEELAQSKAMMAARINNAKLLRQLQVSDPCITRLHSTSDALVLGQL